MRYQRGGKSQDWVELSGVAELRQDELDPLWGSDLVKTHALLSEIVVDCCFTDRHGVPVDPRIHYRGLSVRQMDWLREKVIEAARDEECDPEA